MKISKAIIAVAGYGTRRLPITKSLEKCMLPIGNRPIVDYLVQDCVRAGITEIIFVVGEQHQQIKSYYAEGNKKLEEYLAVKGKQTELEQLKSISGQAKFSFVLQDSSQPYGTAVPLALCADLVNDGEQVLYLAGDDFVYNPDGESEVAQLIDAVNASGATSGMLAAEIPMQEVNKYGVIEFDSDGSFLQIVEKPRVKDAPSNLINISKYVFDKDMAQHAVVVLNRPAENGECQVTDALNMYLSEGKKVAVVRAAGEYLDGGTLDGWLHANNRVVGKNK